MDGSVSTLAPLFAAAFATRQTKPTFLVGLAAAIGAGISMGFAEAWSDNGWLSGRGSPRARDYAAAVLVYSATRHECIRTISRNHRSYCSTIGLPQLLGAALNLPELTRSTPVAAGVQ